MYQIKSAYSNQTATVNKLLEEGYEPFSAISGKFGKEIKIRFYFKKQIDESGIIDWETAAQIVATQVASEINSQINRINIHLSEEIKEGIENIFKDFPDDLVEVIGTKMEKFLDILEEQTTLEVQPAVTLLTREVEEENEDNGELNENVSRGLTSQLGDRLQVDDEGEFLSPEDFGVTRERPNPKGDTFRVVDEVPVTSSARTPIQDEMIQKIKNEHKTNITISPINPENSSVTVWAEDKIYTIRTDGSFSVKDNLAQRQSLSQ